jgi:hypothetical protein
MSTKQLCKNDENPNIIFSYYFEKNLSKMMKILTKKRKEKIVK